MTGAAYDDTLPATVSQAGESEAVVGRSRRDSDEADVQDGSVRAAHARIARIERELWALGDPGSDGLKTVLSKAVDRIDRVEETAERIEIGQRELLSSVKDVLREVKSDATSRADIETRLTAEERERRTLTLLVNHTVADLGAKGYTGWRPWLENAVLVLALLLLLSVGAWFAWRFGR